jgi:hypothetical protein
MAAAVKIKSPADSKSQTLNPTPQTPNPKPETLNLMP